MLPLLYKMSSAGIRSGNKYSTSRDSPRDDEVDHTVGKLIVGVPLFLWFCFFMYGVVDWVRNGRKRTDKSYFENRAR